MNNVITGLASTLSTSVNNVQSEIVKTQTDLAAGKKTLNPGETGVVTRLSAQAAAYGTVVQNVVAAQNVINVAQSGMSSIVDIMVQMKNMAVQASSVGLSDTDRASLQETFYNLATQVASLGTSAAVNDNNLLDGTTLTVTTDITGNNDPTTTIGPVDVATTAATIEALDISTADGASAALLSLTTEITTMSSGQASLSASLAALEAQGRNAQKLSDGLSKVIDSIQNIDPTKLQAYLQNLNTQQSVDYYLVSQMNTEAAAVLTIFR